MKTGIMIRCDRRNVDLIDLKRKDLFLWVKGLDDAAKTRTIIHLLSLLREGD